MRFVTILLFILLTVADKIYGSEITIEAENGTVSGGYAVVDEYFASGYKAVRGSNEGSLAIPFRIEEPGTYYVRFRAVVVDEGYRQHPFHVFIDENDLGEHGGDVKGSFAWKAIMHGVRLEKGQHKLIFKKGEMGLVDRVRLSVLPSVMGYDSPESVETECKTADFIRVIDLGKLELTKDSICYLGTMVRSKTDQEVCIRVDSQLPIILWLNGKEILRSKGNEWFGNNADCIFKLSKGENNVLVRGALVEGGQNAFYVQFLSPEKKLINTVRFADGKSDVEWPIPKWSVFGPVPASEEKEGGLFQNRNFDPRAVHIGYVAADLAVVSLEWKPWKTEASDWLPSYETVLNDFINGKWDYGKLLPYEERRGHEYRFDPAEEEFGTPKRTFYASPDGNDKSPGTKELPWETLQHAVKRLKAGDLLLLASGIYGGPLNGGPLRFDTSGEPGAYITIRAMEKRKAVLTSKNFPQPKGARFALFPDKDHGSYVRLQGLVIRDSDGAIQVNGDANHIVVDDCEITGCARAVIDILSGAYVAVRNLYAHDNGNGIIVGTKGVAGTRGIFFDKCYLYRNRYHQGNTDGIVVEGFSTGVSINNCVSVGHGDSGFDIKPTSAWLNNCFASQNGPKKQGFKLWRGSTCYNCVSWNNHNRGFSLGFGRAKLINCTSVNNPNHFGGQPGVFRNCIFWGGSLKWTGKFEETDRDYNLYYAVDKEFELPQHSVEGDPGFINISEGDFRLTKNSVAIGRGDPAWAPERDMIGTPRKKDSVDLGAFAAEAREPFPWQEVFARDVDPKIIANFSSSGPGTEEFWIEAENGKVSGDYRIEEEAFASEGRLVRLSGNKGALEIPVEVKDGGLFHLNARVMVVKTDVIAPWLPVSAPFDISVDNGKFLKEHYRACIGNLTWAYLGKCILSSGKNILKFSGSHGSMIDRVWITPVPPEDNGGIFFYGGLRAPEYELATRSYTHLFDMTRIFEMANPEEYGSLVTYIESEQQREIGIYCQTYAGDITMFLNGTQIYCATPTNNSFSSIMRLNKGKNSLKINASLQENNGKTFSILIATPELRPIADLVYMNGIDDTKLPIPNWAGAGPFNRQEVNKDDSEKEGLFAADVSKPLHSGGHSVEWKPVVPAEGRWFPQYASILDNQAKGMNGFGKKRDYEKDMQYGDIFNPSENDFGKPEHVYYVSVEGNDKNPGTKEKPWKTVQTAIENAQPGDEIRIMQGDYNIWNLSTKSQGISVTANGRPGKYITFRAWQGKSSDDLLMENMLEDMTLQDDNKKKTIQDVRLGEIGFGGYQCGNYTRWIGLKILGSIFFDPGANHVVMEDCEVTGSYYGIRVQGSHIAFRRVQVHHNRVGVTVGVKDSTGAWDILFKDCIHERNNDKENYNTDGIAVENMVKGVVIRNCISVGHGDSGFDIKPNEVWLDGCFTYLNEKQGYKIWRGATLHNCIAWKTGSGIQISGRRAKLYGCTIADCSPLIDHSPEEMWNCILMNGRCTFDNEDFSRGYNCWFNVEGMPKLGPGSISSDPEFLNPKKGDFRPSANSPVAGKGSLEKALSYDAAGTLRRNRIDIGAYQHDAEKFICWESDQQEVSPGTFHE